MNSMIFPKKSNATTHDCFDYNHKLDYFLLQKGRCRLQKDILRIVVCIALPIFRRGRAHHMAECFRKFTAVVVTKIIGNL